MLNENTRELVKAGEQAQSLNNLIKLICFQICPTLLDLVLATSYMGHEFGIYIVFIVLALVMTYFWLVVLITTWVNPLRRI
jgi:ABC-type transport system involved in Fe-S cluster assembly fused permease/ATPase subunit